MPSNNSGCRQRWFEGRPEKIRSTVPSRHATGSGLSPGSTLNYQFPEVRIGVFPTAISSGTKFLLVNGTPSEKREKILRTQRQQCCLGECCDAIRLRSGCSTSSAIQSRISQDADQLVNAPIDDARTWTGWRAVLRKVRSSTRLREEQALWLADAIRNSPHPTLVAGDFNDTPQSYTYRMIRQGLRDSFEQGGWDLVPLLPAVFPVCGSISS